ncbi:MAG: Bax inhibitor-1/YccA family protein [Erysipelotrichaceae bacterium]
MNNMDNDLLDINENYTFGKHVSKTFGWMFVGLLITFVSALVFLATGISELFLDYAWSLFIVFGLEMVIVFKFSKSVGSASTSKTLFLYVVYCIVTGITFAFVGMVFDLSDIVLAFGATVIYFGSLAVIGSTTKFDLSKFRNVLFVSLIVLLVLELLGAFVFNMGKFQLMIMFFGLFIFTALTVYDTQMMHKYYLEAEGDITTLKQYSLYSAFQLYLDFINIFLYILRLFASSDD